MYDTPEKRAEAARKEVAELVAREGLLNLIFEVEYKPVMLPEGTPPEVVSAWLRLSTQGVKDVDTIRKWVGDDD